MESGSPWWWQNSSFPHMDGQILWRKPVEMYMERQKILISLGSILLLLKMYAKEMIIQKKQGWRICRWKIWVLIFHNKEKLGITQGNHMGSVHHCSHAGHTTLSFVWITVLLGSLFLQLRLSFWKEMKPLPHFTSECSHPPHCYQSWSEPPLLRAWIMVIGNCCNSVFLPLKTIVKVFLPVMKGIISLLCSEPSSGFPSDSERAHMT